MDVRSLTADIVRLAGMLAVFGPAGAAFGEALDFVKIEFPHVYVQGFTHIGATTHPHSVTPAGVFWDTPLDLNVGPASGRLRGEDRHLIALHAGEPAPGPRMAYNISVPMAACRQVSWLAGFGAKETRIRRAYRHGGHWDNQLAVIGSFHYCTVGGGSTKGYVGGSWAVHTSRPRRGFTKLLLGPCERPPVDTEAAGALLLSLDDVDRTFGFATILANLRPEDVQQLSIRLGSKDENGPSIVEFGPDDWQAERIGDNGAMIVVQNGTFPPAHLEALFAGGTYLQVHTGRHPGGEIRGQIEEVHSWGDDFDTYAEGPLAPQSDWEPWNGDPNVADFVVTGEEFQSEPHSVAVDDIDDAVRRFVGYDTGRWAFSTSVYVPQEMDDVQWFILLSRYPTQFPDGWSLALEMNGQGNPIIRDEGTNETLPLVKGTWTEVRVEIDLDNDVQSVFYGGEHLVTKSWTQGVGGEGDTAIAAVDLWGDDSNHSVYYDDFTLVELPKPTCPPDIECPPEADDEPEACGADENGGCNDPDRRFTPLECGQTYCGTVYFDGQIRDTDWYELVVTQPTTIRLVGESQFDGVFGIVNTGGSGNCEDAQVVDPYALTTPCSEDRVALFGLEADLQPGTWWFFAAPQFTDIVDCGAGDRYWMALECVDGNDCPWDIDGNGDVGFGDILAILSAWGNKGGPEDLDGSGTVDFGDILVVLGAWGPCP